MSSLSDTKSITSETHIINSDILQSSVNSYTSNYVGDFLVKSLEEAKTRCNSVLGEVEELLDQVRLSYPRLYFVSDAELTGIIFACNNIRFSIDDFKPVFQSISKSHISTADTERIIGMSNTLGEMYLFTNDFPIKKHTISDLLKKIES